MHKLQLSLEFLIDSSHTKNLQPFGDGEELQAEHGSAILTVKGAGENCREHNPNRGNNCSLSQHRVPGILPNTPFYKLLDCPNKSNLELVHFKYSMETG